MPYKKGILFRIDRKRAISSPTTADPPRGMHNRTISIPLRTATILTTVALLVLIVSIQPTFSFFILLLVKSFTLLNVFRVCAPALKDADRLTSYKPKEQLASYVSIFSEDIRDTLNFFSS